MTAALYDVETMTRTRKFAGHSSFVNSCCPCRVSTNPIVVTAGDDASVKLWDVRSKKCQRTMHNEGNYQVLAACFNDIGSHVFTAGIDELVKAWDLRNTDKPVWTAAGHTDSITGLSLSPDGTTVLSNSMDQTVRTWDARPFCKGDRMGPVAYQGAVHNYEKLLLKCSWSPDGKRVSAGSSCNNVHVWEASSGNVLYKLPGHKGSVAEVTFHPKEPIIASAGSDKVVFLGELH